MGQNTNQWSLQIEIRKQVSQEVKRTLFDDFPTYIQEYKVKCVQKVADVYHFFGQIMQADHLNTENISDFTQSPSLGSQEQAQYVEFTLEDMKHNCQSVDNSQVTLTQKTVDSLF